MAALPDCGRAGSSADRRDWEERMTLSYGFVKAKMTAPPRLTSKAVPHGEGEEQQYHLHFSLDVNEGDWDIAANVGTDYANDLLKYKIVQDFHHPIVQTLRNSPEGVMDLTGTSSPPALDFLRSGILDGTGAWRDSDVSTAAKVRSRLRI
jgi:hypothetical protein